MSGRRLTRRDFTMTLTAAGIGGLAAGCGGGSDGGGEPEPSGTASQAPAKPSEPTPVALQLYTVREAAAEDFRGTVGRVAGIGYDAVEFAGYGGMAPGDLREFIGDLGLACAGAHVGWGELEKDVTAVADFHRELGNTLVTVPSMPGEYREGGADAFRRFGEKLTVAAEALAPYGIALSYHNHNFEFATDDGGRHLIGHLLDASDPSLVKLELDVYWAKYADVDPAAFMDAHSDRIRLMHMKDMVEADGERTFAPVGAGTLDMPGIVAAARRAGAEWFIVEQDRTRRPVFEAITTSLANMRTLLG